MKVSIVVTAYNSQKTIRQCIGSVLANDYPDFELLVVDDCSTDATTRIIDEFNDERLHVFRNRSNRKVCYSRNLGIKKSRGGLILFLDADSYVDQAWIQEHATAHKTIEASIIGGGIQGIHQTIYGQADAFCTWYASVPDSGSYYVKNLHVASNNMSVKREALNRIGLFDERLTRGGEDTEFCFRAAGRGEKIYFKSDIVIYHWDRDNCRNFFRHQRSMGKYVVQVRSGFKMNYSFLIPGSYWAAWLYLVPLAFFFTVFIIGKWLKVKPGVIFYFPLIFAGKLVHTWEVKNSFILSQTI